eukprot:11225634-Lingulodinium_polyedra.AAC.1
MAKARARGPPAPGRRSAGLNEEPRTKPPADLQGPLARSRAKAKALAKARARGQGKVSVALDLA